MILRRKEEKNLVLALESTLSLISVAMIKQLIGGAIVPSRIALTCQRSAVYHQYASDFPPEADIGKVREFSEAPSDVLAATGVPIAGIMSLPSLVNLFCSPVQAAAAAACCRTANCPLHPLPYPNFHCNQTNDKLG